MAILSEIQSEQFLVNAGLIVFGASAALGAISAFSFFILSDPFSRYLQVFLSSLSICAACGATVGVLYALLAAPGETYKGAFLAAMVFSGALGAVSGGAICLLSLRKYIRWKTGRPDFSPGLFTKENRRLWR